MIIIEHALPFTQYLTQEKFSVNVHQVLLVETDMAFM